MPARYLSLLIAAVLAIACGQRAAPPVAALPQAPASAAATSDAAGRAGLVVAAQQVATGLRVRYQLPAPTSSFRFYLPAAAIRNVTWHVLTPGLALVDDEVTGAGGVGFDQFEVFITPDAEEHDRVYPSLFSMGPGAFALNTQSLLGAIGGPIAIELRAREGHTVASSFQSAAPVVRLAVASADAEDKGHYVYLGPPQAVGSGFIVAPSVPAWLRTSLDQVMTRAVPLFAERFGQRLATHPFVLVTYVDDVAPGAHYRGDTQANGEIALRFYGTGWREPTGGQGEAALFLLHELVHLWNAELFQAPEGQHLAWLHEGSAEYLALVAARELRLLTPTAVKERVGDALGRCASALGPRSLVDAAAPAQSAYYTCGVVVQWLAEVSVGPNYDAFAIWRNLFAAAASAERRYHVDGFQAEVRRLSPPTRAPLLPFLFATDATRDWTGLPALVAPHGVRLVPMTGPSWDAHRLANAVQHLLRGTCHGPHGFYTLPDHLRLDTGDHCGVLSGDPTITSAEGHDLLTEIDRAVRAIDQRCRRSLPVRLGTKDGQTLQAACSHPVPAPSPMFRLE